MRAPRPAMTPPAAALPPQGRGTKLADIPNVHHRLSKLKTEDEMLQALHQALYRRPGTVRSSQRLCQAACASCQRA